MDDGAVLTVLAKFSVQASGAVVTDVALSRAGSNVSTRRLVARTCAEAANAVALIVAVALDQSSGDDEQESTPKSAPPSLPDGTSATATTKPAPEGPATSAPRRAPRPNPPAATPRAEPTRRDSAPEAVPSPSESIPSRTRFGAYLAAQGLSGPAPEIMPGLTLHAMLGLDRSALWSPAIVLGLTHAVGAEIEAQGGTASFSFDAASLDACPVRWEILPVEARACGSAMFGRLSAEGTNTQNPAGTVSRPFWVVGGSAALTARIGSVVESLARVSMGTNLVRDSFEFSPFVFHSVGPVTLTAGIGLGVRTP